MEAARDALPNAEAAREFLTAAYIEDGDRKRSLQEKTKQSHHGGLYQR